MGYAVYQFEESGLNAHGNFEAAHATEKRNLVQESLYDLEQFPSPRIALDMFKAVTKPTSMLILEVPNCGGLNAEALGLKWGPFSSALHPISFTSSFFVNSLSRFKGNFHCTSKPFYPKEIADRFRENPSDKWPPGNELIILKAIYQ